MGTRPSIGFALNWNKQDAEVTFHLIKKNHRKQKVFLCCSSVLVMMALLWK